MPAVIRVIIPYQLQILAGSGREVEIPLQGDATIESVMDGIEARYPMLKGTLRDQVSKQRRPFIRFFACEEDLSLEPTSTPLPAEVLSGEEPFRVVGAMAGG